MYIKSGHFPQCQNFKMEPIVSEKSASAEIKINKNFPNFWNHDVSPRLQGDLWGGRVPNKPSYPPNTLPIICEVKRLMIDY